MAKLIPSLNSCLSRMQSGEKRFAYRLESHLEDDYLCWYESAVGRRAKYTDFIILHPLRGLLLLEVKDWKLETIQSMDRVSAVLVTGQGLKTVANPLEQARQCTYRLTERLETDPQLLQPSGRYQGRLAFPYGYGVVLSRITRRQFEGTDLGDVIPAHRVICSDEMVESVDAEDFQGRLWDMFNVQFPRALTLPQIDRIRWHLFPEIRINSEAQKELFTEEPDESSLDALVPDIVKVMDRQQELLARSLGEGHRVIHGVAGSGKTLILGYRCLYLAKLLHKPILVLCYNITLAARLREMMIERGVNDRVHVYHFHDWCGEQLRSFHVDPPAHGGDYFVHLVEALIAAVEGGRVPKGQYGAVMIDEGHDFAPEWLKLVSGMVDPESDSLLLLYDDAQSIYGNRRGLDFSLSSVGIQARGRTTVMKLNYRNTEEILGFAYRFARRYLSADSETEEPIPLVEPESAGRHGPAPVVKLFASFDEEARYIAHLFAKLNEERALAWADMCVTFSRRWMGAVLEKAMTAVGVPCVLLGDARSKRAFRPADASVKLMTMHSSKGLEFPVVAVCGIGHMAGEKLDPVSEAKLLYVAMTRSTQMLLLTSDRETAFVEPLLEVP
ncbi:MAG: DEAD/DEAH box helicase [Gammaproteobacteria bacterium]